MRPSSLFSLLPLLPLFIPTEVSSSPLPYNPTFTSSNNNNNNLEPSFEYDDENNEMGMGMEYEGENGLTTGYYPPGGEEESGNPPVEEEYIHPEDILTPSHPKKLTTVPTSLPEEEYHAGSTPSLPQTQPAQSYYTPPPKSHGLLDLNLDLPLLGHIGLDVLHPSYDIHTYAQNTTGHNGRDGNAPFSLLGIRSRPVRRHLALSHGMPQEAKGMRRRQEGEGEPAPEGKVESPPPLPESEPTPEPEPEPSPPPPSDPEAEPEPQPATPSTNTPDTPTPTPTPETPSTEAPAAPSTQAPDTPSTEAPAAPSTQAPNAPTSTQAPEAPSTQAPDTPSTHAPSAPSTAAPSAPSTQAPDTPSTQAPDTPSTAAPSAPSTAAPSTPPAPTAPSTNKHRVPVFSESAAELIQAEMAYVRAKYANAMKVLYNAPLAAVDVVVDGGEPAEGVDGGEVGARVTIVPGKEVLEPIATATAVPTTVAKEVESGVGEVVPVETTSIGTTTISEVSTPVETTVTEIVGSVETPTTEVISPIETTTTEISSLVESTATEVLGPVETAISEGMESAQVAWSSRRSRRGLSSSGNGTELGKRRASKSPAVPLTDYIQGAMDVLYYGEVGVGSPEQVLTVDFDTGSADLWLPSQCKNCKTSQFDNRKSSTYKDTGKPFTVEYGAGSVSGRLVQDVVKLGNSVVKNQYFGAVDEESQDFTDSPHAGVMGMAFSSISSSGQKTYFENLIDQGSVKVPIFSFHLARHQEHGSQLCIGCYDSSKFTGSFTWLPLVSKTYWSVSMTGFSAKGANMNALSQTLIGAIDTGTTLIYVPPRIATQFYSQILGSEPATQFGEGFFQYPCKADTSLKLRLGLNNKGFDWSTKDFNLGRTGKGSSMCVGAILGVNDGFPDDLAIIGDVFLKSWYSVYDQSAKARVGFASSSNNTPPPKKA